MGNSARVELNIFTRIADFIDYSYIVGTVISTVFLYVFIRGLLNKHSPLRTSFYFFTAVATASDIICTFIFYIDAYVLSTVLGKSDNKTVQETYKFYINPLFMFIARIFLIMDFSLESVLTFNRLTAFVFPFIHNEVRSLYFVLITSIILRYNSY